MRPDAPHWVAGGADCCIGPGQLRWTRVATKDFRAHAQF